MHKLAAEYKAEITKQRQRLRNNMSEAMFKTWHAKTSVILEYIPEIVPLKRRFAEIEVSNESTVDKISQARGILSSIVEIINSPLFGTGKEIASPLPQFGGFSFAQHIMQTQDLTQSINVDLDTLLRRVDEHVGLTPEDKEEAKSLVRKIWDNIKGGTKDVAPIFDLMARLATLGVNVQQILSGLQFGQ